MPKQVWKVKLEPAGAPMEARAAAEQARRLVAGWLRQDMPAARAGKRAAGVSGHPPAGEG